jgi:RecJ-like exonuclease
MKHKWTWLVLITAVSAGIMCTSVQQKGRHAVSRHAVIYEDVSLDQVWDAAREAVQEIGFNIRMENREKGFLDSVSAHNAYSNGVAPLMNIMIHDTAGQIRVDCLMAQDPEKVDSSRDFLIRFFTELEKRLNK